MFRHAFLPFYHTIYKSTCTHKRKFKELSNGGQKPVIFACQPLWLKVIIIIRYLKPIFHQKLGSRWLPNANEIYTKNMKCT